MTTHTVTETRPARWRPPTAGKRSGWPVPLALVLLSLIPVISGALRLVEIVGGLQLMPTNPRIDASPAPLVVHVVGAVVYALFGAFQFSTRLRRRHAGWHRGVGRIVAMAGVAVALSGLWMTLFYAAAPGGTLLWSIRLLVSTTMAAAIVLGFAAVRRRDIAAHRAWMMRAYALGLGAGTQTLTEGVAEALFGTGDLTKAISMSSAWAINALVAEWVIRHRPGGPTPYGPRPALMDAP